MMKYKLKVYSIWEYGKRKDSEGNPHQEDCTFPLPEDLKDTDRTFILCDGMGGHDAGEVASATVCQAMGDYILHDGHDAEGVFTDEDLRNTIDAAFKALDKKDNGAEKKMGTTMTLLKLHNEGATIAHMGDSRVYHIRPGKDGEDTEFWATEDHSLVNDLIKIGELTKEEARTSKQKNVITRAMQPNMERRPKADVKHISNIKAGDFFYMCSDGMLEQEDMENGESIKNIFSNAIPSVEDKVKILTRVTEENRDNHTALIIHILEVEGGSEEEEKRSTAVPSIDFGLVEGDEPTEGTENTHVESENSETEENAGEASKKDEQKENGLQTPATSLPAEKTSESKNPKSAKGKLNIGRWILRFFCSVIIVVACILGYNYIQSCSEKKPKEQAELSQHDLMHETEGKRPTIENTKSKDRRESPSSPVGQETPQEVALEAANSEAAQAVVNENPSSSEDVNGNPVIIPLPTPNDVVDSDQQVVSDTLKKK